jgi:hypothetical protein
MRTFDIVAFHNRKYLETTPQYGGHSISRHAENRWHVKKGPGPSSLACRGDGQSEIVHCCEVLKPGPKQGLARSSKRRACLSNRISARVGKSWS